VKYSPPKIIDLKVLTNTEAGNEPDGCDVGKGPPVPICSNGNCDDVGCSEGTFPGVARVGSCVSGTSPELAWCCAGSGPTGPCSTSPC